jgi:hypothetical protein
MVWRGTIERDRTPLVAVDRNLTGIRYWDEIVQCYVFNQSIKKCLWDIVADMNPCRTHFH